ncbi:MAG: hypothetical protein WC322_01775 [Candidatus Paceibacterota bacterium]|jgi:hypothetical protein
MPKTFYLFQPVFNKKERKKIIEKLFDDFDLFVFSTPSGSEGKNRIWVDIFFSPKKTDKGRILSKLDKNEVQRFQILEGYQLTKKNKNSFVDVVSAIYPSEKEAMEALS